MFVVGYIYDEGIGTSKDIGRQQNLDMHLLRLILDGALTIVMVSRRMLKLPMNGTLSLSTKGMHLLRQIFERTIRVVMEQLASV